MGVGRRLSIVRDASTKSPYFIPIDSRSLSKYRTVAQPGPRIGTNGMEKSRQHLHDADEHEQNLLIGFGSFSLIGLSVVGFGSTSLLSMGFEMSVLELPESLCSYDSTAELVNDPEPDATDPDEPDPDIEPDPAEIDSCESFKSCTT